MSFQALNLNAGILNKSAALHNAAKGLQYVLKTNLSPKGTIKMDSTLSFPRVVYAMGTWLLVLLSTRSSDMKKVFATLRALVEVMEALSKDAAPDGVGRLIVEVVRKIKKIRCTISRGAHTLHRHPSGSTIINKCYWVSSRS